MYDVSLLNKILFYCIENNGKRIDEKFIANQFEISLQDARNINRLFVSKKLIKDKGFGDYNDFQIEPFAIEFSQNGGFAGEKERQNKPSINIEKYLHSTNNSGIIAQDSSFTARDIPINQRVTTTPSTKESTTNAKAWYNKPEFIYLVWPLLVVIIGIIITLILKHKFGLG